MNQDSLEDRRLDARPVLEIEEVSYCAGGALILDRVSWQVRRRQHWALLGPNGAGKTTLLRIACGFLWPNEGGTVRRCSEPLVDLRELRRSIGWISWTLNAAVPKHERVLDTVVSGRFAQVGLKRVPGVLPTEEDRQQASHYLWQLGCQRLQDKPFGVLSQGEQQKVLIARARMARPLLLFLDEPCAGMDPGARERFLAKVDEQTQLSDGPSIVLVTHHIEEIMPGMSRTLVLHEGRVLRSGRTSDVLDAKTMTEVYGVAVEQLVWAQGRVWPIWASSRHQEDGTH